LMSACTQQGIAGTILMALASWCASPRGREGGEMAAAWLSKDAGHAVTLKRPGQGPSRATGARPGLQDRALAQGRSGRRPPGATAFGVCVPLPRLAWGPSGLAAEAEAFAIRKGRRWRWHRALRLLTLVLLGRPAGRAYWREPGASSVQDFHAISKTQQTQPLHFSSAASTYRLRKTSLVKRTARFNRPVLANKQAVNSTVCSIHWPNSPEQLGRSMRQRAWNFPGNQHHSPMEQSGGFLATEPAVAEENMERNHYGGKPMAEQMGYWIESPSAAASEVVKSKLSMEKASE